MLLYSESCSGALSSTTWGGGGGWSLPVETHLLRVNHVWSWPWEMAPAFSWRASKTGGHSDTWAPGGVPALCLSLRAGGLMGGSSQLCISQCMLGVLSWVSQEAEGRGWRGSSRPGTGLLSQLR